VCHENIWGSGGVAPFRTSALGGGEWSFSRPGHLITGERTIGAHWRGGWLVPRGGLDIVGNRKILILPEFEPQPVACRFLIRIVGGGVQLGPLGTLATNRPVVPSPDDYDDGEIGGMMIGKGNRSTRRKPAPVPLCPPQTPYAVPGHEPGPPRWEASLSLYRLSYPDQIIVYPVLCMDMKHGLLL
jgi:hypothetical protein